MNVVFISPHFPHTYWQFCDRLKRNGANVLGIADTPYENLPAELKGALTDYYRVDTLEDYDSVYRGVAFFASRYGRIDWIESNNEYWLEQDARLRTDFNVCSGVKADGVEDFKEKSAMKKFYAQGGVPTARQIHGRQGREAVVEFSHLTGFPLIAKPDVGVGASDTHKIHDEAELNAFFDTNPHSADYVIEEFITGNIYSYDAICNAESEPLFESATWFPPSIMDIVNKRLELSYVVQKEVPAQLRELGRRTLKAFGVKSRFVHFEFFCLTREHKGLGKVGDFVGLEVNMRPAGGYTPDMINYAHSTDVYKIWADVVCFNERRTDEGEQFYCAYCSRRDIYDYAHSHEEVRQRYGQGMVMCERMPDVLSGAMGNQMYTVKLRTQQEVDEFIEFVTKKK
ncbi:MAG: hypothetical protein J6M53_08195 [Bacteroidaceae bacterium]|nr:hypothetical protein [Bacteroidaceae bacterium]